MTANDPTSLAAEAVKVVLSLNGTVLDYTPESLNHVDSIVLHFRNNGTKEEKARTLLYVLGCYVGEVIVRGTNSRWTEPPKEIQAAGLTAMGVTSKKGIFWNPIGKVYKLFQNGIEDSVRHFYDVIEFKER
jgi:hypothetical protein